MVASSIHLLVLPLPRSRSRKETTPPLVQIQAKSKNITSNLSTQKFLIDPNDHSLNITYESFGMRLNCRNLFSVALDALAALAHDDVDGSTIDMFTGLNWSQNVVYQTSSDESPYGKWLLTPDVMKRVMRLLPQRLYEERSCGEVKFEMVVKGLRQGAGRFWVADLGKGKDGVGG